VRRLVEDTASRPSVPSGTCRRSFPNDSEAYRFRGESRNAARSPASTQVQTGIARGRSGRLRDPAEFRPDVRDDSPSTSRALIIRGASSVPRGRTGAFCGHAKAPGCTRPEPSGRRSNFAPPRSRQYDPHSLLQSKVLFGHGLSAADDCRRWLGGLRPACDQGTRSARRSSDRRPRGCSPRVMRPRRLATTHPLFRNAVRGRFQRAIGILCETRSSAHGPRASRQ